MEIGENLEHRYLFSFSHNEALFLEEDTLQTPDTSTAFASQHSLVNVVHFASYLIIRAERQTHITWDTFSLH